MESGPSTYDHFFGITIVSAKNRVFFRIRLHFESIQNIPVRHSGIIYIIRITLVTENVVVYIIVFFCAFDPFLVI